MKISIIEKNKFKNDNFARVLFSEKIAENRLFVSGKIMTLEIKIPEKKKMNRRQAILIARKVIAFAKINRIKKLALDWNIVKALKLGTEQELAEIFGINFEMANYEFVSFKTMPKEGWNFIEEIAIITDGKTNLKKSLEKGQLIGRHVNMCRELANTPGSNMTPQLLVTELKKAIKNTGIKMKVLDEKEMKKLGMNAVLAVAQGSK
jgi:leucyl aminopeptidase